MANNNQKPTNNQERATAIFDLAVSINHTTRLANELATRKEASDKANWEAEEFFRELPESIGSNSTVNIAGNAIARNVPGIEHLLEILDKLGMRYYESLEASQALPKLNSFYAQLVGEALGTDEDRFFKTLAPAGDITDFSKISNKDSKTNPAEDGIREFNPGAGAEPEECGWHKFIKELDEEDDDDYDDDDDCCVEFDNTDAVRYLREHIADKPEDEAGHSTDTTAVEDDDIGYIVRTGDIFKVGDINISIGSVNLTISNNVVNDD
jgi:hypothetical protein